MKNKQTQTVICAALTVLLCGPLACTKHPATTATPKTVLDETPPAEPEVSKEAVAVCGDGIVQGEEQCDDGNRVPWGHG